ncbi:MAG: lasso peptide biosynthesis B2 protein [Acidimicrobiales bacterium]
MSAEGLGPIVEDQDPTWAPGSKRRCGVSSAASGSGPHDSIDWSACSTASPRRGCPRPRRHPRPRFFRGAGACLSRGMARSQYLRMRGIPTTLVLGVAGGIAAFDAHAWLEPIGTPDRPAIYRIAR